ncbi:MAG: tRNA (adenosine(37)-N6)-threonylcarbamoyltransferase complex dimerization subunit type 1 TsaB [Oscillospiraceae bacterium]|nr:tRNA (adenosine(37)-N6)-threonylcarbamoyltransferase complex dimerization subunit type 1 TsaB [Oscillospiraceae bacterium]
MILGIDSSAITAGCALYDSGRVIAEQFLNTKHTHSQTLLPMVENMLKSAEVSLSDVETIAVTAGPGSFTGLRIGIASVKGMAMGAGKRCVSVSTLEAIAYNFVGVDGIICCAMDARCGQVYNALFRSENGIITRLCEDRAIKAVDLYEELKKLDGSIILAGDGAEILHKATEESFTLAPLPLRYQRGLGVCLAAEGKESIDAAALMPSYLRLPQAERERLEREKEN